MKNIRISIVGLFFITALSLSAQNSTKNENQTSNSYLGWISKSVNFRSGPSKEFAIIKRLDQGKQIFIVSDVPQNGYLNIIDIESNTEGYEVLRKSSRSKLDHLGRPRYYAKEITPNYWLSSQWYEHQRELFLKWMKSI